MELHEFVARVRHRVSDLLLKRGRFDDDGCCDGVLQTEAEPPALTACAAASTRNSQASGEQASRLKQVDLLDAQSVFRPGLMHKQPVPAQDHKHMLRLRNDSDG